MTTAIKPTVHSLELEITGKCQATCTHCLADSGPTGTDGTMTPGDWRRIIDEAHAYGIPTVQFIGGEPTLYKELPALIEHAVGHGLEAEVFSNLIHVRHLVWDVLTLPGVRIGTSYYSDQAEEHELITRVRGSYGRTRANIAKAVGRGIRVRAGIVHVLDGQRVEQAEAELRRLGVERITIDQARPVGRAANGTTPTPAALCGRCTRGRAAILPNGDVAGCVMSRFMPAGNVHEQSLETILTGPQWADIARTIPAPPAGACPPDDSDDCNPANTPACVPKFPNSPDPAPTLEGPA